MTRMITEEIIPSEGKQIKESAFGYPKCKHGGGRNKINCIKAFHLKPHWYFSLKNPASLCTFCTYWRTEPSKPFFLFIMPIAFAS